MKEKISAWVNANREQIISRLSELVQVGSPTGQEQAIVKKIKELYELSGAQPLLISSERSQMKTHAAYIDTTEMGCPETYEGRPNVVVIRKGSGNGRSLILNAHCDTIGVSEPGKWTRPPFSGQIADGKIFGRGAADDKSGIAIGMAVLELLDALNLRLKGDLIVQNVIEEEAGGNGTLQCVMAGQRADGAIILENVGMGMIVCGSRGVHFFKITIYGEPVSILNLWEKPSSLDHACKLYEAIKEFNVKRNASIPVHPLWGMYPLTMPKAPIAVMQIVGGRDPSTTPDSVTLIGSAECMPNEGLEEMRSSFSSFLNSLIAPDASIDNGLKGARIDLQWWGMRMEPSVVDTEHQLVKTLSRHSESVLGWPSMLVGAGGCDMRLFNLYAETPCVMYGAKSGNGHGNDEYVEIDSLLQTIMTIAMTVIDFCGSEE